MKRLAVLFVMLSFAAPAFAGEQLAVQDEPVQLTDAELDGTMAGHHHHWGGEFEGGGFKGGGFNFVFSPIIIVTINNNILYQIAIGNSGNVTQTATQTNNKTNIVALNWFRR